MRPLFKGKLPARAGDLWKGMSLAHIFRESATVVNG